MNIPVFDLHCDTALGLMGDRKNGPQSLRKNSLHIDLERASRLAGYCQCFACFTTPAMEKWMGMSAREVFSREIDAVLRELEANKDRIGLAKSVGDIEKNRGEGRMSAVLTIEGSAGFDFDPGRLEELYQTGFRISSLGWNEHNCLTGSNVTGGGLTDMGREYVREAQRLGMIVDVSHISDEGFWDIMDITQAPIVATHSNSRTVCGHSRNLTDDMFLAICRSGGVAGFNQCAPFVAESGPDLDTVCDHILHFLELDPSGRHIALGGDLDGCDEIPAGFTGVESYPAMAQRLLERGVEEGMIRDIFWNNAFEVMKNAVPYHQK